MSTPNPATTNWVPLWNLNGAAGMNYRGAYVSSTQYIDGDIVVYNGVAYMCVRPTSNPPAVWPMAPGTSAYGTSLPASPYDGQEAVLVDSVTAPAYTWRFRYNAQSLSPYKWEFVGGSEASAPIGSGDTTTSVFPTFQDIPNGPAITVPRAGDYIATATASAYSPVAGANAMMNFTGDNSTDLIYAQSTLANAMVVLARRTRLNSVAASTVIRLRGCSFGTGAQNILWDRRNMLIYPVRVA